MGSEPLSRVKGSENALAGAQDNGTTKFTSTSINPDVNSNVSGGDGTYCFIDEDNSNLQISSSQYNYLYVTQNMASNGMEK